MGDMRSIVEEYFLKHPIDVSKIIANYESNCKTKILDDVTGKPFELSVDNSKLNMVEKKILTQEVT